MKNMIRIKKLILYGLLVMFFSILLVPAQVEAGFPSVVLKKEALKQKSATGQTEEKSETNLEKELEAKQKELETLKYNKPKYLITCQYCGGTQESNTICNRCNGTGIMDMPGNDAMSLSLVFSCASCGGSGYEYCKMCINGKMADPDYFTKCETWNEKIENLEEDIMQLDMQLHPEKYEAKGNGGKSGDNGVTVVVPGSGSAYSNPSPVYPDSDSGWNLETKKSDCVRCKGSGREQCSTCGGSGYLSSTKYAPDYAGTGGGQYTVQTKCTCDNGYRTCGLCLGSGKN